MTQNRKYGTEGSRSTQTEDNTQLLAPGGVQWAVELCQVLHRRH